MNPPTTVGDPSLLQHEPLRSHIAMLEQSGARSESSKVVSSFVKAMQQDRQAALASRAWAYLVFEATPSADGSSFEVTDKGEELYKVFFEYQLKLSRELKGENFIHEAHKYHCLVFKRGSDAMKLKYRSPNTQRSTTQGRANEAGKKGQGNQERNQHSLRSHKVSGPTKDRHQGDSGNQRPTSKGDISMSFSSSLGRGSHSTTESTATTATQQEPSDTARSARLTTLSGAKPSKRSNFEKVKKRKPSSQEPPVITPSDASEEDNEPSKTRVATAVSSISYRSKRIATRSSGQPLELLGVKSQVVKSGQGRKATHGRNTRRSSAPTGFRSDNLVSRLNKGRPSVESPLSRRKRTDKKLSNGSNRVQRYQASFHSRRMQKMKSNGAIPTRPSKRQRLQSMSNLDGPGQPGAQEVSNPSSNLRARFKEHITRAPPVIDPPLTQEKLRVKTKARRKRTRNEFETNSAESGANVSVDSCESEPCGPDARPFRPLPRRVRNQRLVSDKATGVRRVARGAASLEHADQLLRDVASNALVILQEGVGPELPDWTQDKAQDAECDDVVGHDQDEANDLQVTTTTSVPSTVTFKPPVPAPPRIWAQSRQEVCESFEYFRSYHSGVYSTDGIVKGYLLGAYAANRDIFHHDGKLIISHGGGKSESVIDSRKGPKRYRTDQDQEASDYSVRALLNTYKDRRPIALLADDKYAQFPYDLTSGNYTYVVLGLYWISHAWAECQPARDGSARIVRWKFAFQWCEGQGDPWWTSKQEMMDTAAPPTPISNTCFTEELSQTCDSCEVQSPSVYKQGWTCLNPSCNVFWTLNGEEPNHLEYRTEFLNLLPQNFEVLPDITPARVVETPNGVTTTYAFTKGWHCMKCGRLSCRYKWEHWECSNCGLKYVVNGRTRSPKEFWHQHPNKEFLHSRIGKDSGILTGRLEMVNLGGTKGFTNHLTFILPHDRGKIHLILGTPLSNPDADNIFRLYQQQASTGELKLRRYPLRNHRARGVLLTNYFSQNSGEPYQYVGGTGNTVPFDEAPECVRQALVMIKERCTLALHTDIPFNEILSAAYMERQKMAFHSDSEKGLGPVVASLSLGSAAFMHFRPHVNAENPKGKGPYALSLILRHGDVLIMEGDGVQTYYEHTVVPMNFRIAATARCIGST